MGKSVLQNCGAIYTHTHKGTPFLTPWPSQIRRDALSHLTKGKACFLCPILATRFQETQNEERVSILVEQIGQTFPPTSCLPPPEDKNMNILPDSFGQEILSRELPQQGSEVRQAVPGQGLRTQPRRIFQKGPHLKRRGEKKGVG